jgi:hypothetical protein
MEDHLRVPEETLAGDLDDTRREPVQLPQRGGGAVRRDRSVAGPEARGQKRLPPGERGAADAVDARTGVHAASQPPSNDTNGCSKTMCPA